MDIDNQMQNIHFLIEWPRPAVLGPEFYGFLHYWIIESRHWEGLALKLMEARQYLPFLFDTVPTPNHTSSPNNFLILG